VDIMAVGHDFGFVLLMCCCIVVVCLSIFLHFVFVHEGVF
jgi:hypothetical protein